MCNLIVFRSFSIGIIIELQRLLGAVLTAAFPGFSLLPGVGMLRAVIGCPIFLLLERNHGGDRMANVKTPSNRRCSLIMLTMEKGLHHMYRRLLFFHINAIRFVEF